MLIVAVKLIVAIGLVNGWAWDNGTHPILNIMEVLLDQ
jgi:hypothetical protein